MTGELANELINGIEELIREVHEDIRDQYNGNFYGIEHAVVWAVGVYWRSR